MMAFDQGIALNLCHLGVVYAMFRDTLVIQGSIERGTKEPERLC